MRLYRVQYNPGRLQWRIQYKRLGIWWTHKEDAESFMGSFKSTPFFNTKEAAWLYILTLVDKEHARNKDFWITR